MSGCGGGGDDRSDDATSAPETTATSEASPTTEPPSPAPASPTVPEPGTVPPNWLGTRVLPRTDAGFGKAQPTPPELRNRRFTIPDSLPALPGDGFASRVADPAPARVIARSTWRQGCPVGRRDLAWVRLTFWGFDGARHTGELLVNGRAVKDLVEAFRRLYEARFPLEEMRIPRAAEATAPPTGDGNNTVAFACRATRGATSFSEHAYGLAVDINPFQNPYVKGDVVLPELASSYVNRKNVRPGMITADGPVVRAFSAIGWGWGGGWKNLKDYQHFSESGR
ncbi:M15 family metallopeptidase [Mumia zhuanghuii]|uniref:M15 family metallopeptidase n=2 Tax=Mumia zhuanghuii TaxID=2585211 RepID=A0A5C4N610_9ACTN|nr:M15 family metallopeptidase [Mumia zhuanghuii]TNC52203.1 M15 family metallopeptidase [Mumia zhuanghuii]